MARLYDSDQRYGDDFEISDGGGGINLEQITRVVQDSAENLTDEVTYPQITSDQNNYALSRAILHRFSSDASRTITGFAGVPPGINVFTNVGTQDLVLANNSGSSTEQNRILAHTGANITVNPNESVLFIYDKTDTRVRTIGFV